MGKFLWPELMQGSLTRIESTLLFLNEVYRLLSPIQHPGISFPMGSSIILGSLAYRPIWKMQTTPHCQLISTVPGHHMTLKASHDREYYDQPTHSNNTQNPQHLIPPWSWSTASVTSVIVQINSGKPFYLFWLIVLTVCKGYEISQCVAKTTKVRRR